MNLVSLSESDIKGAIERLQANQGTCGDIEAAAAWAVLHYEQYVALERLSKEIRSLMWGADGKMLDELLDESSEPDCPWCNGSGIHASNPNAQITTNSVCGFCGCDAKGFYERG